MSVFDELNEAYSKWRDEFFDNQRRSVGFAHRFAEEFRRYIGAPDRLEPFPDHDMVPKYVWACKAVLNEDENTLHAISDSSHFEAVQIDENGRYYFALAIRCEHGPGVWPKQWFPILVRFSIDGNKFDIQVTSRDDGHFSLWIEDTSTWAAPFNFITSVLKQEFARKPNERGGKKERIGFVFPVAPLPDPKPGL